MKEFLKNNLPSSFIAFLRFIRHPDYLVRNLWESYLIKVQPHRYKKIVERLRHKDQIKVAFFALQNSVWKYDFLYQLMSEHPRFDPIIIVCPIVNYGMENMLVEMDKCYNMFHAKGYNVVRTYDVAAKTYLDVKKEINPDIVFYSNPYKGLIDDKYYITNFLDRLTCYVPYSASICNTNAFNKPLQLLVWRFFVENDLFYKLACKQMFNDAINVIPIGYPSLDGMLTKSYVPQKNVWKHEQKYKIIWAPHHSFDAECFIHFSNFFQVSTEMFEIAEEYKNEIQIAFKPHPLLYIKLLKVWGKEKTNRYYQRWADGYNTQYENGDYIDLFITSDAMIFDSVSFMHEYLFTMKRSLFVCSHDIESQLNDFGKEAFMCHQKGYTIEDIKKFIDDLLMEKEDFLINIKNDYYYRNIVPINAKSASQSIINDILKSIE